MSLTPREETIYLLASAKSKLMAAEQLAREAKNDLECAGCGTSTTVDAIRALAGALAFTFDELGTTKR